MGLVVLRTATSRRRDWLPTRFASRSETALLARQPQPMSLADNRISGDATAKPLGDGAGRLSRDPEALQQLNAWLVPVDCHAENPMNDLPASGMLGTAADVSLHKCILPIVAIGSSRATHGASISYAPGRR